MITNAFEREIKIATFDTIARLTRVMSEDIKEQN